MSDHGQALKPGTILHEFKIEKLLGEGGFGLTYLAYDNSLEKYVAIKEYLPTDFAIRTQGSTVMPRTESSKDDFDWGLNAFIDEARVLARFDHANIVRVNRFFQINGTAYIVMEYVDGRTLTQLIDELEQLTQKEMLAILKPLLAGLQQVHQQQVYHRDIKPDNIIIRDNGSPVLIDFGAARQAIGSKSRSITTIVTPGYAPIEQYSSKGKLGAWTDIYALAAVSYTCLTGHRPDDASDRVVDDEVVPAVQVAADQASPEFLAAIDAALAIKAADRPQSIDSWMQLLQQQTDKKAGVAEDADQKTQKITATAGDAVREALAKQQQANKDKGPSTLSEASASTVNKPQSSMAKLVAIVLLVIVIIIGFIAYNAYQDYLDNEQELTDQYNNDEAGTDESQQTQADQAAIEQAGREAEAEQQAEREREQAAEQAERDRAAIEQQQRDRSANDEADTIADLLAKCQTHFDANRLTTGNGGNALDCYQQVLAIESNNRQALSGIEAIEDKYSGWAQKALTNNQVDKARQNIAKLTGVNPDNATLADLEAQLAQLEAQLAADDDRPEAFRLYLDQAEQGDPLAQLNLADAYDYGVQGLAEDDVEAIKWYRRSAEQGNATAQNNLGFAYWTGEGIAQNYIKAVEWYRKAALQGDKVAQLNLATAYDDGQGVVQDKAEAFKWFQKAADQDYANAQHELAYAYQKGIGVEQSHDLALQWYRKAAQQGYAASQNQMGFAYWAGNGVSQNYVKAAEWFKKAAQQGYSMGQNNLGNAYHRGEGVEQDMDEAKSWYQKSARQGNTDAQDSLEEMGETW